MKNLIEQEILRQGYKILQWQNTLKDGWGVKVEKDGYYTIIFIDEIVDEILKKEVK